MKSIFSNKFILVVVGVAALSVTSYYAYKKITYKAKKVSSFRKLENSLQSLNKASLSNPAAKALMEKNWNYIEEKLSPSASISEQEKFIKFALRAINQTPNIFTSQLDSDRFYLIILDYALAKGAQRLVKSKSLALRIISVLKEPEKNSQSYNSTVQALRNRSTSSNQKDLLLDATVSWQKVPAVTVKMINQYLSSLTKSTDYYKALNYIKRMRNKDLQKVFVEKVDKQYAAIPLDYRPITIKFLAQFKKQASDFNRLLAWATQGSGRFWDDAYLSVLEQNKTLHTLPRRVASMAAQSSDPFIKKRIELLQEQAKRRAQQ